MQVLMRVMADVGVNCILYRNTQNGILCIFSWTDDDGSRWPRKAHVAWKNKFGEGTNETVEAYDGRKHSYLDNRNAQRQYKAST